MEQLNQSKPFNSIDKHLVNKLKGFSNTLKEEYSCIIILLFE